MRRPASVLVVDDDPRNRRLLVGLLGGQGHRVREAEDGAQALTMAADDVPDLVLLDVMMPGISGLEVCRELKRREATRTTQVMLVTALDGTRDLVAGLDCGADDHVSKPVRRDELLAKVRALLRVRAVMRDLEDARRELASRNEELELKRTLAQTLVHDLKNPLAAILGNLELLERRADDGAQPVVRRSRASAARMQAMIVDLLDVERLETGRLDPRRMCLDAAELAASATEAAAVSAAVRGVVLRLAAPAPALVTGDPALCRRMLDNLIANGLSRTPPGSVVEVRVGVRGRAVELAVVDRGPDVPLALRDRIFDKYHPTGVGQVECRANRGLGLTLCRLAAEAHGGAAWVDEVTGGGAIFGVRLPAAPVAVAGDDERALTA